MLQNVVDFFVQEMPGQTLAIILTVILVPMLQGFFARGRYKKSRRSLLTMLDIHFNKLGDGVKSRDPVIVMAEAAVLDELMRTVAATMRPEMIARYDDYLHDLITNQGNARDLKYESAAGEPAHAAVEEQFQRWRTAFEPFRKHFA